MLRYMVVSAAATHAIMCARKDFGFRISRLWDPATRWTDRWAADNLGLIARRTDRRFAHISQQFLARAVYPVIRLSCFLGL
jgi:hypothetical protein